MMLSHSESSPAPAGTLWKEALPVLCQHLKASGMPDEEAIELGEALIIACALRYDPRNAGDALKLALGAADSWQRR
jgi:hypothetical protein